MHCRGTGLFGAHAFGRVVPSSAAVTVECLIAVPAVLIAVRIVMIADEEDAAAVLHVFRHSCLLAGFIWNVRFGHDEDVIAGKIA
ncbi:hypothetical protein D3C78_1574770 [compost metagenome]